MPFLIFVFGLIIGSFLNSVIYRSAQGGSIFAVSSECPYCAHKLFWADLIPIVSFFILRRRCRYCRKPISRQYPLVELAAGLAFALIYVHNVIPAQAGIQEAWSANWILTFLPVRQAGVRMTDWANIIFQFIFTSFLIVIFVYDLKHYLILDGVVWPAAVLAAVYQIWLGNLGSALLGTVLLSGFFGLLHLVSRGRWIGLGDVKLAAFLGFLVPYPSIVVLFFLAYILGASVSLVLLALRSRKLTDQIPFGTFLTTAAFIAMLWGEEIINWYFRLIGLVA